MDPVLYDKKKIEPEIIIQQLLKRDESDRNSGKYKNQQVRQTDETAYYNNNNNNNTNNNNNNHRRFNNYNNNKNYNNRKSNYNNNNSNQSNNGTISNHRMLTFFTTGAIAGAGCDMEAESESYEVAGNAGETNDETYDDNEYPNSDEGEFVGKSYCTTEDLEQAIQEAVGHNEGYALAAQRVVEKRDEVLNLNEIKSYTLILDSASTRHVCCNEQLLTNIKRPDFMQTISGLGNI